MLGNANFKNPPVKIKSGLIPLAVPGVGGHLNWLFCPAENANGVARPYGQ